MLNADDNVYKTIIFDFDGTLCSSVTCIAHALQETFSHFGYQTPSLSAINDMLSYAPDLNDTFFLLEPSLRNLSEHKFQAMTHYYNEVHSTLYQEESPLYPGVADVLSELHQQNIELIIVSNNHSQSVHLSLRANKIDVFFGEVFGSDSTYPSKPDASVFEDDILPSRPDQQCGDFLMVGDTETDFYFAKACGIDMVWADYGFGRLNKDIRSELKACLSIPKDLLSCIK